MEKDNKTILALALSTLTPTIVWIVFVPLVLLLTVLLNPIYLGTANVNLQTQIIRFLTAGLIIYFWWGFFFAIFVFIFSCMHMLFLGIPAFLIANRLKIIRWYTVLPASFFIGGAPYILFMWGTSVDLWIGVPMTMGLFGFSAGMAFWLLWRYWVMPEKDVTKDVSIASHTL
jgi:hypothetical protein